MNERAREALQAALPAYEVGAELGRGAFGVVYAGQHTQLGRNVAIKQLPQAFAADPDVRERFVAEAQMVASLDHPHIVPVYDFVENDQACLLIMERCEGSVGDRFKQEGIVTDEACAAVLACLAALDFAHEQGLLHRDVKPENLMYDSKGIVKLADFGIARALDSDARRTATGMVVGTPAYMSPEQVRGDVLTPASDVYATGMMAYELLSGTLPFPESPSINGLLAHHLVTEPRSLRATRPELPGGIGAAIDRSLSKDLSIRYATAEEFATALARACVTAFGSGWMRRRRFVLHWPVIVAETERPDNNSPRTGTIVVRAGDASHLVITPDEALAVADDPGREPVGALIAQPPPPGSPATPPAPPAPAPAAPTRARASNQAMILRGVAALVLLLVVGAVAILLTRGGDDASPASEPTNTTEVAAADPTTTAGEDSAPITIAAPSDSSDQPSTSVQAATPTTLAANDPSPDNAAFSDRPSNYDPTLADSWLTPTPCPDDQERVACLFAGVGFDEATGELNTAIFTEGFVPELEPAGYHVHFYFDTEVDGDESAAGAQTPGADWKPWDQPTNPVMSFNGENGRTFFTLDDAEAANAQHLCVIVADPEQNAIPGSGNCAPMANNWNTPRLVEQIDRLTGRFIGTCSAGATAIVPDGWRSVDLTTTATIDAATFLRPTDVETTAELLDQVVANGGVVWADGPVTDGGIIPNVAIATYAADVRLSSSADEVAAALGGLGITASGRSTIAGRSVVSALVDNGTIGAYTYYVPDHGTIIAISVTGPLGADTAALSERIAATVQGC